jgi:hypothetical protein
MYTMTYFNATKNSHQPFQTRRTALQTLLLPSQDTHYLVAVSRHLLETLFKSGYAQQKVGVQLDDFHSIQTARQQDFFVETG